MSIHTAVYIRVVPQDRERGYMLLVGYDNKIVQKTATELITLSNVTRASLDFMINKAKDRYNASSIIDVTAENIKKQLAILFGEEVPKEKKEKKIKE